MNPIRFIWLLLLVVAPVVRGQTPDDEVRAQALQAKAFEAFDKGDFAAAERLLREQLSLDPENFVIYYNLACARSMQGDAAGAGTLLVQAVEHGFTDVFTLQRDPHLANARGDENYQKIVGNWSLVLTAHRDANLKIARGLFAGEKYAEANDDGLRLSFLSAMDPQSTEQARADIRRLAAWGVANVFPDLADEKKAERDAWVVVVLPTTADFRKWQRATFGADASDGFSTIGGMYSHDNKRLVAMDLGATLRHEFFHVLHWRSVTRLGQDHPPWVQEGLCSLVEDYDLVGQGESATINPVPSWRTNIAKRLLNGGKLPPLRQLASMTRGQLIGSRPLATYGHARTVFLYLWQRGKLKDWYARYTGNYAEDPTGLEAVADAMGMSPEEVERDFRAWLRDLPMVAEQTRPGNVGLGVDVDPGTGDGPVIAVVPRSSPARRAGLRVGDVITAIDGKPTRDLNELVRVLGTYGEGAEVEVSYRRGTRHETVRVTLEGR
jgi:hypothetical protein